MLASVRAENIEALPDGTANAPDVVAARVEQVGFERPTVRLVIEAGGSPLEVAAGGLGRLSLRGAGERHVRLRLREVSLVRVR